MSYAQTKLSTRTAEHFAAEFRAQISYWRGQSLSTRAATVLAKVGVKTKKQVYQLGRRYFEEYHFCGSKTILELDRWVGWPPKYVTATDAIVQILKAKIPDSEEAREVADDALNALRTAGFLISTHPRRNAEKN
jgi:hypothetical protein